MGLVSMTRQSAMKAKIGAKIVHKAWPNLTNRGFGCIEISEMLENGPERARRVWNNVEGSGMFKKSLQGSRVMWTFIE